MSRSRSAAAAVIWLPWLRLGLGVIGFAAALGMVVQIVGRHSWRLDLSPDKRFSLSERSVAVLRGLDRDVRVLAFVRADDARNPEIEDLLRRAAKETSRLQFETVDLNRSPAIARQYEVGAFASFVVESGALRRSFTNPREDSLVQAILEVTGQARRVAYFVVGHGEGDLRSNDRRSGYSELAAALRAELFEWRALDLAERGVPEDADVVVVLGPHDDWPLSDLLLLRHYVEGGGRVFLLLDPGPLPSLAGFLAGYGVQLGSGVIVDSESRLFAGDQLTFAAPGLSVSAEISRGLKSPPVVSGVRDLSFAPPPPRAEAVAGAEVLSTAASARLQQADVEGGGERRGPLAVAVSVEVAVAPERTARLLVVGDSDFAGNSLLEYLGNKDFYLNGMNWLSGSGGLIGTRVQKQVEGVNQLFVTEAQGRWLLLLATVIEPGLFVVMGFAVYLWRRLV